MHFHFKIVVKRHENVVQWLLHNPQNDLHSVNLHSSYIKQRFWSLFFHNAQNGSIVFVGFMVKSTVALAVK